MTPESVEFNYPLARGAFIRDRNKIPFQHRDKEKGEPPPLFEHSVLLPIAKMAWSILDSVNSFNDWKTPDEDRKLEHVVS